MSDHPNSLPPTLMALTHAREVAYWIVLLLGWLWLGEQGMHLGWSWASGVLAVALWWSVRLFCRGSAWALGCAPWVMGLLGLFTALGAFGLKSQIAQPWAHGTLLCLAVVWGLWIALIETRSQVSTFQLGPLAWHPVLAAGLLALGLLWPAEELLTHLMVLFLLALCVGVLYAHEHLAASGTTACRGQRAGLETLLAPSAMGLMMGTLWLGNAWCASLSWSNEQMVGAHLALMAGLPTLTALLTHGAKSWQASPTAQTCVSLSLIVVGALMLLGNSAFHGVLAMLLPSLAWAVHCSRQRIPLGPAHRRSPWLTRSFALLLGPVLLVWVGAASPTQGPWAMQSALALMGVLAAGQLVFLGWRKQGLHLAFSAT
ncbi:hypothetical protein [Limnohabitans sp. 15K]|uniref:hypothetical protein n=1 Tax=Limnohabitans sp. 15K TaxID=1100706 RepID=UPI00117B695E|nr:hypothetical protein [Limnohabitans sp. 15K]